MQRLSLLDGIEFCWRTTTMYTSQQFSSKCKAQAVTKTLVQEKVSTLEFSVTFFPASSDSDQRKTTSLGFVPKLVLSCGPRSLYYPPRACSLWYLWKGGNIQSGTEEAEFYCACVWKDTFLVFLCLLSYVDTFALSLSLCFFPLATDGDRICAECYRYPVKLIFFTFWSNFFLGTLVRTFIL